MRDISLAGSRPYIKDSLRFEVALNVSSVWLVLQSQAKSSYLNNQSRADKGWTKITPHWVIPDGAWEALRGIWDASSKERLPIALCPAQTFIKKEYGSGSSWPQTILGGLREGWQNLIWMKIRLHHSSLLLGTSDELNSQSRSLHAFVSAQSPSRRELPCFPENKN